MKLTSHLFALALVAPLSLVACSDDDGGSNATVDSGTATDSGAKDTGAATDSGSATDTGSSSDTAMAKDIVDTAIAAGSFKTLVAAVQAAGLESALRGKGPFTVFAPTDDAFAKVDKDLVAKLVTADYKTELALILKYHVLAGSVKAADVLGKKLTPETLLPGIKLSVDGSDGKTVLLNGTAKVGPADVMASNGVIHVLDNVLLPTIADTAMSYDDTKGTTFKTLVTALVKADLAATFMGSGTFTVFAPTDKAFADLKTELGATAFDAVLADKVALASILKYHVLGAVAFSKSVTTGDVTSLEGTKIGVTVASGKVTLKDGKGRTSNVVLTDLPNSNGVIHAIDKVILPK